MQSDVQAGQVFVRAARRAGQGTEPKYRECPAEIGTVGSYVYHTQINTYQHYICIHT